jgi:dihydroorotase
MPDVISSDVHVLSIDGPAFNMLITMSKFLKLGMPLAEVIRASTINAAAAVRLTDRGTLKPGMLGDATILEIERGHFSFHDVMGIALESEEQLACRGIVLGGRWWHG